MRLLLDECVPHPFKFQLHGHEVSTVGEMGWKSKRNSELLTLMLAHGFTGFLTVDQNLEFQQNVRASGLAVVVLVARTNRLKELRPLLPATLDALTRIKPGELLRVGV